MSPALSVAEHLIMVAAIMVSLAVMIILVFLGDRQPGHRRPGRDQPDSELGGPTKR
ncbi:MAG TPA: hypothetical protein VH641_20360 [Streptosporangiaceae bacterium]|jgi:hypothetical protein